METVRRDIDRKYNSTTRLNLDRKRASHISGIVERAKNDSEINFNRIIYGSDSFRTFKVDNKFKIPYESW
jgi:hypothetical protein